MRYPGINQIPKSILNLESMDIETDNIIAKLFLEDIKYIWKQLKLTQKYKSIWLFSFLLKRLKKDIAITDYCCTWNHLTVCKQTSSNSFKNCLQTIHLRIIYIYIYIYIYVCVCVCVCVYIYIYIYINKI